MITLRSTLVVALAFAIAVALAACGERQTPAGGDTDTDTDPPAPAVDWLDPSLRVDLGDGYQLAHCPGDAPIQCITHDGQPAGLLELASYPLGSLAEVEANREQGERAALRAHVEDFVDSLEEDRATGCGPDYRLRAEPPKFVATSDGLLVRYGFSAGVGDVTTERTLQWAGIRGEELTLLSITAIDEGACVPRDELESTTADLAALEPHLRRLVEASPLPSATLP